MLCHDEKNKSAGNHFRGRRSPVLREGRWVSLLNSDNNSSTAFRYSINEIFNISTSSSVLYYLQKFALFNFALLLATFAIKALAILFQSEEERARYYERIELLLRLSIARYLSNCVIIIKAKYEEEGAFGQEPKYQEKEQYEDAERAGRWGKFQCWRGSRGQLRSHRARDLQVRRENLLLWGKRRSRPKIGGPRRWGIRWKLTQRNSNARRPSKLRRETACAAVALILTSDWWGSLRRRA